MRWEWNKSIADRLRTEMHNAHQLEGIDTLAHNTQALNTDQRSHHLVYSIASSLYRYQEQ
jgi:hypothetical protein